MIYGANGYTGTLIAEESKRRSMEPILAGRNLKAIEELGQKLSLKTEVFSVSSTEEIVSRLEGIFLVLNCAGPFFKFQTSTSLCKPHRGL